MPQSNDEGEIKGGHAPAMKVGGVRIPTRPRRSSGETSKSPKDKTADSEQSSYDPFKPHALVENVQPARDLKDYPKGEIQHAHQKPVPTHQQPHQNRVPVIQQPKK